MANEPKPNFASFTKAELIKTIKKLDARQTKLLNRIAELESADRGGSADFDREGKPHETPKPPAFPWST